MKIPSVFYGSYEEVRRRMKGKVGELKRVRKWVPWEQGPMTDTSAVSGVLVLGNSVAFRMEGDHFFLGELVRQIVEEIFGRGMPIDVWKTMFIESLEVPWSLLTVSSRDSGLCLWREPEWVGRYVLALARHWNAVDEIGARYAGMSHKTGTFWERSIMLRQCLARLGIANDRLDEPLPPGGLPELLRQVLPELTR